MKVKIVKEVKNEKGFTDSIVVEWSENGMYGSIFADWKDNRWIIDSEMLGLKKTIKILNRVVTK